MPKEFGLPYFDALLKSVEISKRNAEAIPEKKDEILSKITINGLIEFCQNYDPDMIYKRVTSIEKRRNVLKKELTYMLRKLLQADDLLLPDYRFMALIEKYKFDFYEVVPILNLFFDVAYNLIKKNPQIAPALDENLKKYPNFKREHQFEGLLMFLPAGKKYGGLAKALLHMIFSRKLNFFGHVIPMYAKRFEFLLGSHRVLYNSKVISQEKRMEWFEKLEIDEADCVLWSKIFDFDYPQYSYIHKLYDQVA